MPTRSAPAGLLADVVGAESLDVADALSDDESVDDAAAPEAELAADVVEASVAEDESVESVGTADSVDADEAGAVGSDIELAELVELLAVVVLEVAAAEPMAICWNRAKLLSAVGFTAKTMPI